MSDWIEKFIQEKILETKEIVGKEKVLATVSGGVDSAVTAKILSLSLPEDQLVFATINDGARREGEVEWVAKTLLKCLELPIKIINQQELYYKTLKELTSVSAKRFSYQEFYLLVIQRLVYEHRVSFLAQGTNKTDRVETDKQGSRGPQHNVFSITTIANKFPLLAIKGIIEPLKELRKEEIRQIATYFGFPPEIAKRQPFPGPGLTLRVEGKVTPEKLAKVARATAIVEEEVRILLPRIFQVLVRLSSSQAVKMKSDGEFSSGDVYFVRAVYSEDSGQTATPVWFSPQTWKGIEDRIFSDLPETARILFDPTPKPPASIEWE